MIKDRHLELSSKFIEMGNALMKEGISNKDYITTQVGNFMILMGGLVLDEDDVILFGQLCGMFSAKKVLDNMEKSNDIIKLLKKNSENKSYEDLIKLINKMRGDSNTPIE